MKKKTFKILALFGYIVSFIVSVVGVAMLTGLLLPKNIPENFRYIIGIVFILYGIYRAVTIWAKQQRNKRDEN